MTHDPEGEEISKSEIISKWGRVQVGLGKAVVLEAIRRCGELGAKRAMVGSGQQFYYSIGFYPILIYTYWDFSIT